MGWETELQAWQGGEQHGKPLAAAFGQTACAEGGGEE